MSVCKLIVSSAVTLVLAGCGGGGGGSSSSGGGGPITPTPPTTVTKNYTIIMDEASVKRVSNGDVVDVNVEGIRSSGTVVVTQ